MIYMCLLLIILLMYFICNVFIYVNIYVMSVISSLELMFIVLYMPDLK